MPFGAVSQVKLGEDGRCGRIAHLRVLPPFGFEPLAQLGIALAGLEDLADVQLRRDGAVPAVLLEPERDVIAADVAKPVELGAEAERDRAAGVAPILSDAEAQVLPLADCG